MSVPSIRQDPARLAAVRWELEGGRWSEARELLLAPIQVRRRERGARAQYASTPASRLDDQTLLDLAGAIERVEGACLDGLLTLVDMVYTDEHPNIRTLIEHAHLADLAPDVAIMREAALELSERQHMREVAQWETSGRRGERPRLMPFEPGYHSGLRDVHDLHATSGSARASLARTLAKLSSDLRSFEAGFRTDRPLPRPIDDRALTIAAVSSFIDVASIRSGGVLACQVHPAHFDALRTLLAPCNGYAGAVATFEGQAGRRPVAQLRLRLSDGPLVVVGADLAPASGARSDERLLVQLGESAATYGLSDLPLTLKPPTADAGPSSSASSVRSALGVNCSHVERYVSRTLATHVCMGCRTCQHPQIEIEPRGEDRTGEVLAMAQRLRGLI